MAVTYNEGVYTRGSTTYCIGILDFYLYRSDNRLEAKNGFGLHTEQVNQRHKIEAFKASKIKMKF